MSVDFLAPGTVAFDMTQYITKKIAAFPKKIMGVSSTPAIDKLFQIQPPEEARYLPEEQARGFYHTTAQLLFLSRVFPNILTTVAFLTTMIGALSNGCLNISMVLIFLN